MGHRDVLYQAQDDEVMKIYLRLPPKAQLLVRDPDPRQNFVRSNGLRPLREFLRAIGI